MAASTRRTGLALLALASSLLGACAIVRSRAPIRIALLAPFEGRYQEVGYNALYAARLAMQVADNPQLELLAVDDGGTLASAIDRAEALAQDPLVVGAVALGYEATSPQAQQALGELPLLIVGHWSARPTTESVFMLSNPSLHDLITAPPGIDVTAAAGRREIVGGEVFALAQFTALSHMLESITVVSSATLPDSQFRERYRGSDPFAPEPGLLATLSYDAVAIIIQAVNPLNPSRAGVHEALTAMTYAGLNGAIRFENGYWADAPIHYYRYQASGELQLADEPQ